MPCRYLGLPGYWGYWACFAQAAFRREKGTCLTPCSERSGETKRGIRPSVWLKIPKPRAASVSLASSAWLSRLVSRTHCALRGRRGTIVLFVLLIVFPVIARHGAHPLACIAPGHSDSQPVSALALIRRLCGHGADGTTGGRRCEPARQGRLRNAVLSI